MYMVTTNTGGAPSITFCVTVNERLVEAGLMAQFEAVLRARDRAGIIAVLKQVELAEADAAFTADTVLGNPKTLQLKGQPVPDTPANRNRADLDFTGSIMPPPKAIEDGSVPPLTDEDRLTIVRWIDLGCPIDLDFDPKNPAKTGFGWMLDDQRPTLTVAFPKAGANSPLEKLVIGMFDYGGLDMATFDVMADFAIHGIPAGRNLASQFKPTASGVRELPIAPALRTKRGTLTVSIKDKQGNVSRVERVFSAGP